MAAASRGPGTSVVELLHAEPERFELVQAVRLLERAAVLAARDSRFSQPGHLGFDHDPRTEVVSLRAAPELAFPVSEITSLETDTPRPQLSVTLLGLNGVSGVLPSFYSQILIEASREKNAAPADFFDLLNHRALSLFVRAAHKYRLPLAYELGQGIGSNTFAAALLALVGLGSPSLQQRQSVPDDALVFYSGHFSRSLPTADSLRQILSEYFDQPVRVRQFQGRWISWSEPEQTRLSAAYATLGTDAVLGSRVWDVQGAFRIVLGPLDYEQFRSFFPDGEQMSELTALTRSYVGPVLSFDVQPILAGAEVPPLRLSAAPEAEARLGWNTWLSITGPRADADEAVFTLP